MPSGRRCSICNINWPAETPTYLKCPNCSTETSHMGDLTWVLSKAEALSAVEKFSEEKVDGVVVSIHPKAVYEHRFGRFMEMGFGPKEAQELADSRHDCHAVRRWLTQGCSLELALQILI